MQKFATPMIEPFAQRGSHHPSTDPSIGNKQALWAWLDTPPSSNAAHEFTLLQTHLETMRSFRDQVDEHGLLLDRLFPRAITLISSQISGLIGVPLPVHRKTRRLVRTLQDVLGALSEELTTSTAPVASPAAPPLPARQALLFWRLLRTLSLRLFVNSLTASPAMKGLWLQLHRSFDQARQFQLHEYVPKDSRQSLQSLYLSTILLGCAQPATFTSTEVKVAACLDFFVDSIEPPIWGNPQTECTFWIDPLRDEPAIASSRKPPLAKDRICRFSCTALVSRLESTLSAIESGHPEPAPTPPGFAETPAGRGVLRHLIRSWGTPGKRRFPRRSQSYRVSLCSGLDALWHLFRNGNAETVEISNWMVINESPDGYALMHVSGKTGTLSVGDIVAIKTDTSESWQTSIVRWAVSENQEHLELGLQLLATQATAALLALPKNTSWAKPRPVLLLPQVPVLRPNEILVVPSGTLEKPDETFVLLVEKDNLSIREIRSTGLDEQNGQIEVFSFRPDTFEP